MRHKLGALLALMLGLLLATPLLAEDDPYWTRAMGGPGGFDYSTTCEPGDVMTGLYFQAGKALDNFFITCTPRRVGGVGGQSYYKPDGQAIGGPNGEGRSYGKVRCGRNMAVEWMRVHIDGFNAIHHVLLKCGELDLDGAEGGLLKTTNKGGDGPTIDEIGCPLGFSAIGVHGRAGTLIDAIGLICSRTYETEPETAPVDIGSKGIAGEGDIGSPPLKVNNAKEALKVNNGEIADAPEEDGPTAAIDTTIYDEPGGKELDFIAAGDPVTIVKCNNEGWCRISSPRKGYVWGDDLDR